MRRIVRSQITGHRLVRLLACACLIGVSVASQVDAAPATEKKTPSAVKAQKGNNQHSLPGRWRETASMTIARTHHTATLLPDGRVLVVGGKTSTGFSPSAELFDPQAKEGKGGWRATGTLHHARAWHTATLLPNGKVLVIGGFGGTADPSAEDLSADLSLASAELYDPAADGGRGAWTIARPLKEGRFQHAAFSLLTGKVLIVGGEDATANSARTIQLYDPAADTEQKVLVINGMIDPIRLPTTTLLSNGEILLVGIEGYEGDCSHYPQRLILSNDQRRVESMGVGDLLDLCHPTATLLPNGKVLIVGTTHSRTSPDNDNEYEGVALLYDPTRSSDDSAHDWVELAPPKTIRPKGQSATLLLNGTVLIVGGTERDPKINDYVPSASAEIYDPVPIGISGRSTVTASMKFRRSHHTATRLSNGTVLVVGGLDRGGTPLASAEIYEPVAAR